MDKEIREYIDKKFKKITTSHKKSLTLLNIQRRKLNESLPNAADKVTVVKLKEFEKQMQDKIDYFSKGMEAMYRDMAGLYSDVTKK